MMNHLTLVAPLAIAYLCSGCAGNSVYPSPDHCRSRAIVASIEYCEVSIFELLADPIDFDGQTIAVVGFVDPEELPDLLGAREESVVGRVINSEVIPLRGVPASVTSSTSGFYDVYGEFEYLHASQQISIAVHLMEFYKSSKSSPR